MVKAALFTIAKRFPQPKSGIQRQIDKMWSIHTMEYYAALKRKFLTPPAAWLNLEDIMFRGISQSPKDKYCMRPYMRPPEESDP